MTTGRPKADPKGRDVDRARALLEGDVVDRRGVPARRPEESKTETFPDRKPHRPIIRGRKNSPKVSSMRVKIGKSTTATRAPSGPAFAWWPMATRIPTCPAINDHRWKRRSLVRAIVSSLFLVFALAAGASAQQKTYETRTLTTITNKAALCPHDRACLLANIAQATASATLVSGMVVARLDSPGGGYVAAPEVIVSGVTCSVAPSLTAAIRHAPPLNKLPISAAEGWGVVTGFGGSGGSQCIGTPTVTIAAPGPGNMTRLRFSVNPPAATSNRWVCDSFIQFIVDGNALARLPLGILFNTY